MYNLSCAELLSRVWLFVIPWTVACQAPWGFSREEYWSGLPCPPPGDLLNPGINPRSPTLQVDSLHLSYQGNPTKAKVFTIWLFRESVADHCSILLSLCCHVWFLRSFPRNFSPSKPFVEVHKNQPHFPKSWHLFYWCFEICLTTFLFTQVTSQRMS